jgi:hypothetical protein
MMTVCNNKLYFPLVMAILYCVVIFHFFYNAYHEHGLLLYKQQDTIVFASMTLLLFIPLMFAVIIEMKRRR